MQNRPSRKSLNSMKRLKSGPSHWAMQPCCTFQAWTVAITRGAPPGSISTSSPGSFGAGDFVASRTRSASRRRSSASQGHLS